jgi:hypothetical protein
MEFKVTHYETVHETEGTSSTIAITTMRKPRNNHDLTKDAAIFFFDLKMRLSFCGGRTAVRDRQTMKIQNCRVFTCLWRVLFFLGPRA